MSFFLYFFLFCMFLALSALPGLCCEGEGGVGGRDGIISLFPSLTLRSIELKIHFYSNRIIINDDGWLTC